VVREAAVQPVTASKSTGNVGNVAEKALRCNRGTAGRRPEVRKAPLREKLIPPSKHMVS